MIPTGFDTERLASLDEFGGKKKIIPAEVRGKYRQRRTIVQVILIFFFLTLPWMKVNGHQALLLDILHREFSFFGLKLYAHDAPYFFPFLAIWVFGLVFVTAVWGRVWCGWACPQTVFIDGVFRRIEVLVEGTFLERRKAQKQPMTLKIFFRKAIKWLLFFLVASVIAHSFIAIFVGSDSLLNMMTQDPRQNLVYFILISSMTALILFDFGWFREQFCTIVCPYGRFQSVLLDSSSMTVMYDENRGEPRRGKSPDNGRYGDCISCRRCVEVCPTGIDIRRGVQMECIACTACMDACNEVMVNVKKPQNLIRYDNLEGTGWRITKPRSMMAAAFVLVSVLILVVGLNKRGFVDANILRTNSSHLFTQATNSDGTVQLINQFHLHIRNQQPVKQRVQLIADIPEVTIVIPENPFDLNPNQDLKLPVFFKFSPGVLDKTGVRVMQIQIITDLPNEKPLLIQTRLLGNPKL